MNFKRISTVTGLLVSSVLLLSETPVQAASFSPFSFQTNWSGFPPKGDILLESVVVDGETLSDFSFVTDATIISNDVFSGGNTGAASSDLGDDATVGLSVEDPSNADILGSLGNPYLSSIVDTEERGRAIVEVSFANPVSQFFFWERGMNSKLLVEALNDVGEVVASYLFDSKSSTYAGFDLDTKEIDSEQRVGSIGLLLEGATTQTLRLSSLGSSFNGPDYKVAAASTPVPEPVTFAGLGLTAGMLILSRRRASKSA
ncbi:MAG: PEP-CTERM sorting domain-containing protein [Leptolyngbyaceae cyanobacterium SL_7_1]|nr:PEP-CTERM sorting domain-containing protein [Leptolyngbyaceae cyanobacterium SL_7_1]